MVKNIVIRQVRIQDAEQYIDLSNLVWRDAYKHIFPEEVFVSNESKKQKMIDKFGSFVANDADKFNYVAVDRDRIVGFISGRLGTKYQNFDSMDIAELESIYIHPDYQAIGIGTEFKNVFVKWAKEHGAKRWMLGVLKDNKKARKIYEMWGGKLDEYTQPFVKFGVEYQEVFYIFNLAED